MSESSLEIVVEKGPSTGGRLTLASGKATIGGDNTCNLVLAGDEFVSSPHVTITVANGAAILRNVSSNGTLVNGRPVPEARLAAGDRLAIGLSHLLIVRSVPRSMAPPSPLPPQSGGRPEAVPGLRVAARTTASASTSSSAVATASAPVAAKSGNLNFKMPVWLMAYLALMGVVFVFFAFQSMKGDAPPGLDAIIAGENQYATTHHLPADETARVVTLLQEATVQERRGDMRSAYEAYREVLGARKTFDPDDPAYRYAARRVGAIGPGR